MLLAMKSLEVSIQILGGQKKDTGLTWDRFTFPELYPLLLMNTGRNCSAHQSTFIAQQHTVICT